MTLMTHFSHVEGVHEKKSKVFCKTFVNRNDDFVPLQTKTKRTLTAPSRPQDPPPAPP